MRQALLWTSLPLVAIMTSFSVSKAVTDSRSQGSSRNHFSNAIERQDRHGRSIAFSKVMLDAGERCASTSRSLFRGDIGINALWSIRCRDTGDWMILIAATGATRVTNCAMLEKARTPCWTRI